jgi:hypothetical protein
VGVTRCGGGCIAVALPFVVLSAPVYAGVRSGRLNQVRVQITGA